MDTQTKELLMRLWGCGALAPTEKLKNWLCATNSASLPPVKKADDVCVCENNNHSH